MKIPASSLFCDNKGATGAYANPLINHTANTKSATSEKWPIPTGFCATTLMGPQKRAEYHCAPPATDSPAQFAGDHERARQGTGEQEREGCEEEAYHRRHITARRYHSEEIKRAERESKKSSHGSERGHMR